MEFLAQNKLYFIIAAAVLAVIIIIALIAGVNASKKRKAAESKTESNGKIDNNLPVQEVKTDKPADKPAVLLNAEEVKPQPVVAKNKENATATDKPVEVVKSKENATATDKPVEASKNDEQAMPIAVKENKTAEAKSGKANFAEEKKSDANPAKPARQSEAEVNSPEKPASKKQKSDVNAKAAIEQKEVKKERKAEASGAAVEAETAKPKKGYSGRWAVIKKAEDEYIAHLYASNGELMLTSEVYSTVKGAQAGIATIKKNVSAGNFEIYRDKNKNYYYKLKSAANRLLCVGETYSSKTSCESSMASVKKFAESAIVSDNVIEDMTLINYVPQGEAVQAKSGYVGKWVVRFVEDCYMAFLYASNGELLLTTESYSSSSGAKTAIANVIKNAEANNFIIDKDKNGRFYYKLRNAQKSVLCVGESYEKSATCIGAIEAVKKYCSVAKVEEETEE